MNSNKRWQIGCLMILAIVAILGIVTYVRDPTFPLWLVALVCIPIAALMLWSRKGVTHNMEAGVKKVITTPIKRTYEQYSQNGGYNYYVVIDEKWTMLGLEGDEETYEIKKELFENLKNGNIIEIHKTLDDRTLKIIKVADAPSENPKTP